MRYLCATLLCVLPAFGNLIQNGGFETPPIVGGTFQIFTTSNFLPGWTWAGPGDGLLLRTNYSEGGGAWLFPAYEGVNSLDMTGPGWTGNNEIYQDIPTTPGTQYLMSWALGNQDDNLGPYPDPSRIMPLIDGVQLNGLNPSYAFSGGNSVQWITVSTLFTAANSTTRVTFRNTTAATDSYAGLDDVFVDVNPSSQVPEPALAIPLLGALGLLAVARRKGARERPSDSSR